MSVILHGAGAAPRFMRLLFTLVHTIHRRTETRTETHR